jgi:hypothetical protein
MDFGEYRNTLEKKHEIILKYLRRNNLSTFYTVLYIFTRIVTIQIWNRLFWWLSSDDIVLILN